MTASTESVSVCPCGSTTVSAVLDVCQTSEAIGCNTCGGVASVGVMNPLVSEKLWDYLAPVRRLYLAGVK